MELLVPAAAAALISLPLILFLYFLKVKRPEVRVATLMFWRPHIIDRQANAPWQRLRWSLLLLLQLAAALLLALALMRPGLAGVAGIGQTTVVLIDGSPSMQATDVAPSRFGAAVAQARSMAGQLGPGQQMAIVLLGDHAQLLAPPSSDPAVLNAALDRAHVAGRGADLGEGISLANAILSGRRGGAIVLLGDGHARPPEGSAKVAAPLDYIPFGSTGENAGIEALTRDSQGSIFVRVGNYGRVPRELKVELRADGRLVDVLPVHVDGNSASDLRWNRLPAGTAVLEGRLSPGDVYAPDDVAWLVTAAPPAHKVLVVTAENGFLVRALRLRPGLEVTVVAPSEYKPGTYDLYVFDGFVPKGKLPTPALVIAPPEGEGPVPAGPQIDPGGVLPANPNEPLLRDVVLKDVHVLSAAKVSVPGDWRTVIAATDAPLLLAHEGEPRMVELTFDIHHSDLPLRAAFPILVQNLVQYLLPGGFENQVYAPGQAVALAPEPDARSLEVTTPDGRTLRLGPPFPVPPLTDTLRSGVYTVRQQLPSGVRVSQFVVQLQDPTQSRIAVGAAPASEQEGAPKARVPRGTLEIWPWLAAVALALVALEWFVFLNPARGTRSWA